MGGQRKAHSALEAVVNVVVGYGIAVAAQIMVFPWFGLHASLQDNLVIGALFTVISLARSYLLRRLFNCWQVRC